MSSSRAASHLQPASTGAANVELIHWPISVERRASLFAQGTTCLYLVAAGHLPPDDLRPGEQWVREDADPIEVHWRIRQLAQVGSNEQPVMRDGCVIYRGTAIVIPPSCERFAALLCEHFGKIVTRDCLLATERPAVSTTTMNTRIHRVRQLLEASGLALTGFRGRGYMLHPVGRPAQL